MATNNTGDIYTTMTVADCFPPQRNMPNPYFTGTVSYPSFSSPEALEDYIKKVRDQNYWCELEHYKEYLRLSEKYFSEDKVYGYHQRDKWRAAVKTYKESGLFE